MIHVRETDSTATNKKVRVFIDESIFPCSRTSLLDHAERNLAPDSLVEAIELLPEESSYTNFEDLFKLLITSDRLVSDVLRVR